MKRHTNGILHFLFILLACTATSVQPVCADELSELYLNSSNNNSNSAIGANILIVLDTSGSMTKHGVAELGFTVDPEIYWGAPYDPDIVYPGPCDANTAYRKGYPDYDYDGDGDIDQADADRDGDGDIDESDLADADFQSCDNEYNFPMTAMACQRVLEQGVAVDHFGEFRASRSSDYNGKTMNGQWYDLDSAFNGVGSVPGNWGFPMTIWRECASDYGNHGFDEVSDPEYKWPHDSGTGLGFTANSVQARDLSDRRMQLVATGNYINYFRWAQTRLAAVQAALREVIAQLPPETRIGVMRFDVKIDNPLNEGSSDGAYMIQEFVELGENTLDPDGNFVLSANRQAIISSVHAIDPADDGGTPLGESLFEALQVYRGGEVHFGADAETWNIDPSVWPWDSNTTTYVDVSSVPESRDLTNTSEYQSPIIFECQKSAVIFLSDGDPAGDKNTDTVFDDLPNATNYGAVDCDDNAPYSCLREVADYMAHEDLSPLVGKQTVTTYTVGFGTDISDGGVALLTEAAERGGGTYTPADNYDTLKSAFQVIFREEIASNQTLSSPAVTVNAFNRLAHEDSLYFTMFDPILDSVHWPGNVKKYRLVEQDDGDYRIEDATGVPALNDDSSTIRLDALSYWTNPNDDGPVEANGGVDGDNTELGGAAGASGYLDTLYSWYGDNSRKDLADSANYFNANNLSNEMLGLAPEAPYADRFHIVLHATGFDIDDEDGDTVTNEPTLRLGAAPHGIPAVVNYGLDEATATQVIYAPTNDGFLHAIRAEDGTDLWSFIPMEVMPNLVDIYHAPNDTYIGYGLDGSIIAHTENVGGIEKKWIFFGMRRGGSSIYALDVTDKLDPKLLWRIQAGDAGFERLAQTWSEPRVATINVGGTATTVLIFGGGYDNVTQDGALATAGYVDDTKGNALYIVKADDGTLLWSAEPGGGDLAVTNMKSSIAAPVEIKDKNGDGLDDLIYAADLGGRIFRFDIDNSAATVSLTGGMIASLGAGGGGALVDNRKFFNEPDVVLVAKDGQGYWAINIGSGDRERPKSNMTTQNYLFSIKDPHVFDTPASYDYGITLADLYDATSNDIQSADPDIAAAAQAQLLSKKGWRVALGHTGEKALARATTFDFRVFFTTFDPTPLNSTSCNSQPGTARLYSMNLLTAGAPEDLNNDGALSASERETVLSHGTIPPPVTIMFIENDDGTVEATTIIGRSDDSARLSSTGVVRRTFWNVERKDGGEEQ